MERKGLTTKVIDWGRRHAREAFAGGSLFTAVVLAACGGRGEAPSQPTETPPPQPSPTRTVETSPTVEATFVPKKLAESQYEPTNFDQMRQAVEQVYQVHPEIEHLPYKGGPPKPKQGIMTGVEYCRSGLPEHTGQPKFIEVDRISTCASLSSYFYAMYRKTESEEAYQASVAVANYFLTELPGRKEKFDEVLAAYTQVPFEGGQTSPSLK